MNKAIAVAFSRELEKIGSLPVGIAGALLGGAAGGQASSRLLKGRYMAPITIGTSLAGSIGAQKLYYGHKRKKMLKNMSPEQKRALVQNLNERRKILRRTA